MAENQCCVTGKDLQVGGGRTEGSRDGGTEAGAEEGERVKRRVRGKGWMDKAKMKSKVIGSGGR